MSNAITFTREEFTRLWHEGRTLIDIAQHFGAKSRDWTCTKARILGLAPRSIPSDQLPAEDIVQWYREGMSCGAIAKQIGLSGHTQVVKILRDRGVTIYTNNKRPDPSHDEWVALYKQGVTCVQIAERYGVSDQVVYRVLASRLGDGKRIGRIRKKAANARSATISTSPTGHTAHPAIVDPGANLTPEQRHKIRNAEIRDAEAARIGRVTVNPDGSYSCVNDHEIGDDVTHITYGKNRGTPKVCTYCRQCLKDLGRNPDNPMHRADRVEGGKSQSYLAKQAAIRNRILDLGDQLDANPMPWERKEILAELEELKKHVTI